MKHLLVTKESIWSTTSFVMATINSSHVVFRLFSSSWNILKALEYNNTLELWIFYCWNNYCTWFIPVNTAGSRQWYSFERHETLFSNGQNHVSYIRVFLVLLMTKKILKKQVSYTKEKFYLCCSEVPNSKSNAEKQEHNFLYTHLCWSLKL